MSAVSRQPKKTSGENSLFIIGGISVLFAGILFIYLMYYTAPEENTDLVKIITVTKEDCIAETSDGFTVNIKNCNAQVSQYVNALVENQ